MQKEIAIGEADIVVDVDVSMTENPERIVFGSAGDPLFTFSKPIDHEDEDYLQDSRSFYNGEILIGSIPLQLESLYSKSDAVNSIDGDVLTSTTTPMRIHNPHEETLIIRFDSSYHKRETDEIESKISSLPKGLTQIDDVLSDDLIWCRFTQLLKLYGDSGKEELTKILQHTFIHTHTVDLCNSDLDSHVLPFNSPCDVLKCAYQLFDNLCQRNMVTWNTFMRFSDDSVYNLFEEMSQRSLESKKQVEIGFQQKLTSNSCFLRQHDVVHMYLLKNKHTSDPLQVFVSMFEYEFACYKSITVAYMESGGVILFLNLKVNEIHLVPVIVGLKLLGPRQNPRDWYIYMSLGALVIHKSNPNRLVIISGLNYEAELQFLRTIILKIDLGKKMLFKTLLHLWYGIEIFKLKEIWCPQPLNKLCTQVNEKNSMLIPDWFASVHTWYMSMDFGQYTKMALIHPMSLLVSLIPSVFVIQGELFEFSWYTIVKFLVV